MNADQSSYRQHSEHSEWLNKLDFYKDEIKIFTGRLEEIANKNSVKEALAEVEKFQNQLIVQRNNIDEIEHVIHLGEQKVESEIHDHNIGANHKKLGGHKEEAELVTTFEKNFIGLKEDFNRFSSKWM